MTQVFTADENTFYPALYDAIDEYYSLLDNLNPSILEVVSSFIPAMENNTVIFATHMAMLDDTWEVNGTTNTEVLSLGLAHLKGEELNSKHLVGSHKGNLFYSLDKNIPLSVDKPKNKIIDSSYEYMLGRVTKSSKFTSFSN